MEWFKELTLTEKIETYGELMFSIGVGSGDLEKMKSELGEMHYCITKDIRKLQEVSEWIYRSVLEVNKEEGEK